MRNESNHRIKVINIQPEEILNGNPKITLGLVWIIILSYQVSFFFLSPFPPMHIFFSWSVYNITKRKLRFVYIMMKKKAVRQQ